MDKLNILEEARALVTWFAQPSGYQSADTEIAPKVNRAFAILAELTAEPTLALKAENAQLHIHVKHLEARIARLTTPDEQQDLVRIMRHAAAEIIAGPEDRLMAALAEGMVGVRRIGVVDADGKLVTGLHVLAGEAWSEFTSGERMSLEEAWVKGYRDAMFHCRRFDASRNAALTNTDTVRVAAGEEG